MTYGEHGILLKWGNKIDDEIHEVVILYQNHIYKHFSSLVEDVNIGYQSLLILLNDKGHQVELMKYISEIDLDKMSDTKLMTKFTYHIPVCYDKVLGLDINALSSSKSITINELIKLHTSQVYKVYFTGFLPGFLYLGGLVKLLHSPRLSKPRLKVPKGSVAIGGEQTGIYPQESPGGWHILGQTPIDLFDPFQTIPSIFKPGDQIKFYAITFNEFEQIKQLVGQNQYRIKKELS